MAPVAQAQLEWRISIKVFTDPNGALPPIPGWGSGPLYRDFSNAVTAANQILDATGRGYRWRLTEITNLAFNTSPIPSSTNSWYNLAVSAATQDDLDTKAKANSANFRYRADAINFYYVASCAGPNGGYCAFPSESQHVIPIAPCSASDVFIHEAGHFFGLSHTFDTEAYQNSDGTACTNGCACARLIGGDDGGITDTPLDHTCWNQDRIATNQYGRVYTNLNAAEQYFVDNTWLNVMSYHNPPSTRFTPDQMDLVTDNSNGARLSVASGRTWFVSTDGNDGNSGNNSTSRFRTLNKGLMTANTGEIVLLRGSNYNERPFINQSVTLRATRGAVTIGTP